ncbi:MAG: hypothetical protein IJY70_01245, partial [Clostridia bacterium]|nr:hypothetical protein [Clostridia bacterium]
IEADKYAILTVSLATEDINGYGANIVLKKGTTVVATIEKITENGDYNFYIKNGSATSNFTVELWLGLNDYGNNDTKLASGKVYFTRVNFNTESTAEVFDPIYASYNANRINEYGIRTVAVSLANEDFMSFNSYDSSSLKRPYNWTMAKGDGAVAYGVFDTQDNAVYDIVPSYYDNGGERFAFVVKNLTKTYSVVTLNNNFTLTTGSYYKLTFSAKVDIPQEYIDSATAKGAFISIGTGYTFEFKQTLDEHNNPTFKTYTFLIKAPDADSTTTISIGLGGKDKLNQQIEGALYINDMTFESLDSSEYIDLTSSLASGVNLIDAYTMRAPLSETPPATDEDHTHTTAPIGSSAGDWWLIPSILLAIAILIAVIGYVVRRFIEKRPKKKDDTPSRATYDRRNLTDNTSATPDTKDNFDKFDDDDDDGATEVDATEVPAEENADKPEQTEDTVSQETAVEEPAVEETASESEVSETTENIGGEPTENAPSLETNDDEE